MAITDEQVKAALDTYNKHPRTYFDSEGWLRKVPDEVIMRRTIEAADAAAWRPIEEAPKDGRTVLVGLPESLSAKTVSGSLVYTAYYSVEHCKWVYSPRFKSSFDPFPTHFRPLPEPPK